MGTLITFVIYFGIFALIALTAVKRPAVAMGGMMCMFGLEQWAQSRASFFFDHQLLTNVLMASVLAWAVIARPIKGLPLVRPFPSVGWWIVGIYAYSLVTLFWVGDLSASLAPIKSALPYILTVVGMMPLVAADLRDLRAALLMTLVVGAPLLAMFWLDTNWAGRSIVLDSEAAGGSMISNHGNPLAVASLAGWVALVAALMHFRGAARVWVALRWLVVVSAFIVLFRSGSRGQLIALVLCGVACWPISRPVKDVAGFALAVGGLVMFLGIAAVAFSMYAGQDARWKVDSMVDSWQGGRLGTAMVLLSAWGAASPFNWVFGLGSSASFDPMILGQYPHLVLAEVLGELGVVGLTILLAIWGLTARNIWHLARRLAPWGEERGLTAVIAALFLFETILTFKQGSLLGNYFCFGFAMIIGRLEVVTRPYAAAAGGARGFAVVGADDGYGEFNGDKYADAGDPGEPWADEVLPDGSIYIPPTEYATSDHR